MGTATRFTMTLCFPLVVCGCRHGTEMPHAGDGARPAVSATPHADREPGVWSAVVQGVRGRLIGTPLVDANGKPQLAIDLELENVSDLGNQIEIYCGGDGQALVRFSAEDEAGTPLPQPAMMGGSYASPPPFWLELPHASSMRINITKGAFEYVSPTETWLRPKTFEAWALPAKRTAKLYLRAKVVALPATAAESSGHRAWTGPLDLPRIALP